MCEIKERKKYKKREFKLSDKSYRFFKYLYQEMDKKNRDWLYTNYGYLRNVLKYQTWQGAAYLVDSLVQQKLISCEVRINKSFRPFLIIRITAPIKVKKLLKAYDEAKATDQEGIEVETNSEETKQTQKMPSIYINNNIINQINHREENLISKSKNTTVQDMLAVYNEAVDANVNPDKEIAPKLVAAFKQKFKTLERFRQYLKHKILKKPDNPKGFLVFLLSFSTINMAMGEMKMRFDLPPQQGIKSDEEVYSHIEALNESPACIAVRKMLIKSRKYGGINEYNAWFTKVRLTEKNGSIHIEGENSFITDYVNTNYGFTIQDYYAEWKKHHITETAKMVEEVETEREEQKDMAELEVIGRIGFKEIKTTERGQMMNLSVGENKNRKGADGKWTQETAWYNVTINGTERVKAFDRLNKGDLIMARGDISLFAKLDRSGNPKAYLTVFADKIKCIAKAPNKSAPNARMDTEYYAGDDVPF